MLLSSDKSLIKKALAGNVSAWTKLVKRYDTELYNYALRMLSHPDDAFDLMQEVFMAVYKHLSNYRFEAPFKHWLFTIAHHKCMEYYRRRRVHLSLDDSALDFPLSDEADLAEPLTTQQNQQQLQRALAYLPFEQKLVIEMKFFQHFTFEQIAQQLGVSTNTIKSRCYSALDKMKQHVEVANVND